MLLGFPMDVLQLFELILLLKTCRCSGAMNTNALSGALICYLLGCTGKEVT